MYKIDIKKIEEKYSITEHGEVFSKIKNKWLTPQINSVGYIMYYLSYPVKRWYTCHSLVAGKFIKERPLGYDINHIDNNKGNNHYSNLEYITHSENVRKSYKFGRVSYWKGKTKPSPELATRIKMSNAKKKPVKYGNRVFNSIAECAEYLKTYRESIHRAIKKGVYKGVYIGFDS